VLAKFAWYNLYIMDEKERFEALLEHMDEKFDILAEGQEVIINRFDKRCDELAEGQAKLEEKFEAMAESQRNMAEDIKSLKSGQDELYYEVSNVRDDLLGVDKRIKTIEKNTADLPKIRKNSKRSY
jgi:peptidoglycan hydrolase CwlO-like protein